MYDSIILIRHAKNMDSFLIERGLWHFYLIANQMILFYARQNHVPAYVFVMITLV